MNSDVPFHEDDADFPYSSPKEDRTARPTRWVVSASETPEQAWRRRDRLVGRIVCGVTRLQVGGRVLAVRPPTRREKAAAAEVHDLVLERSRLEGAYPREELPALLASKGLWSFAREEELRSVEKDVEELKVKMLGSVFRSVQLRTLRASLRNAESRRDDLTARRHCLDHLSCEAAAETARMRFLLCCTLLERPGSDTRLVPGDPEELWFGDDSAPLSEERISRHPLFEKALEAWAASRIPESEIREIARTDPWTSIRAAASSGESSGGSIALFGVPAVDLTEDQLRLISWSRLYENVAAHPETPGDEVLADDDLLDGWLIVQRRKREKTLSGKRAESALGSNRAINGSEEVFVVVDSPEDALAVDSLNDEVSRSIKRRRFSEVDSRGGAVAHVDLSDVRQFCRMQAARMGMRPSAGSEATSGG